MQRPGKISRHKKFTKAYKELSTTKREKVDEALALFASDPHRRKLNLHELEPKGCGIWSINAGGDLRCLFVVQADLVIFIALGTHSQLYG